MPSSTTATRAPTRAERQREQLEGEFDALLERLRLVVATCEPPLLPDEDSRAVLAAATIALADPVVVRGWKCIFCRHKVSRIGARLLARRVFASAHRYCAAPPAD